MIRGILRCALVLLVLGCEGGKRTRQLQRSSRLYPRDYAWLFDSIQTHGWTRDSALAWNYFFIDPDSATLRRLAKRLESAGYRAADFLLDSTDSAYLLQLEKAERHTPSSLDARHDS